MFKIHQFAAVRPIPTKSAEISCEPGERLLLPDALRRVEAFPHSWMQVIRPDVRARLNLPEAGRAFFERMKSEQWMCEDSQPRMYIYRQVRAARRFVALVAALEITEPVLQNVLRIQQGDAEKNRDTQRHDRQLGAHAEIPLFAYQDLEELTAALRIDTNERPLAHFLGKDGATHTAWYCKDTARVTKLVRQLKSLVALSGDELFVPDGDRAVNQPLEPRAVALVPIEQISIRASHIVVHGGDAAALAKHLRKYQGSGGAEVPENPGEPPSGFFDACIAGAAKDGTGCWTRCRIPSAKPGHSAAANWDRTRFEHNLLAVWLAADTSSAPARIRTVNASITPSQLAQLVGSGEAAAAFVFATPSMGEILEIAHGHECIPHGAITLEQAVPSGLFVQSIE